MRDQVRNVINGKTDMTASSVSPKFPDTFILLHYSQRAHCFHMEVKVAFLNAISENYNFFEVKLVSFASLCLGNLDQM